MYAFAQVNEEEKPGQMVLGGGDNYQTVTIVPSETSSGEVSYVLIVQQPEGKDKDGDEALTVYDFDDQEEPPPMSGAVSMNVLASYINWV